MDTPTIFLTTIGAIGSASTLLGVIFPRLEMHYLSKGWSSNPKIPMSQMGRTVSCAYFTGWTLLVVFANSMLWAIPVMALLIPIALIYRRDKRDYENSLPELPSEYY